jgi:alpha-L-rhamnosidase
MRSVPPRVLSLGGAALLLYASMLSTAQTTDWPPVTSETRPWTRWWWLGSAVDEAGLTAELEAVRAAGIGGVEITPIYGVAGAESRFVPYLSERWVSLLTHTLREARRLGLGVDMATGTGWPFGGPWIGEPDACRTLVFRTWTVEGGQRLEEPVRLEQDSLVRALGNQVYEVREVTAGEPAPSGTQATPLLRPGARAIQIADLKDPVETNENLQALALEQVRYPKPAPLAALVAYSPQGESVDLTTRVSASGMLDWTAPPSTWTLHAVFLGWHGKLVERAAPGGEGNVIDHFSRDAIRAYLARFDRALADADLTGLRAFFNDSYEVDDATGQADGTRDLFGAFQRLRGYDLRRHLPALVTARGDDRSDRILADYRQTISDLLLETFTSEWAGWARGRGRIVRNQAHGSPANLLDLYAASDIPETEGYDLPRLKWATSAAHVAGRRLVSAEAATWLGEHFRSTLGDARAAVDTFFLAGVNHIVYHGTAYSPRAEPWPGYLFYASVEFNERNPWWTDFGALNAYVTRVQTFLQAGGPDQDVLLYYPFYDSIALRGSARLRHFGGANAASEGTAFEEAAATLQRRGFTYDYISDRQLATVRVESRTVVLPASRFIPLETFQRVLALAKDGATVLAFKGLPAGVAGFGDLDARQSQFRALRDGLTFGSPDAAGISEARVGRGVILRGDDLDALLARARIAREPLVDRGLEFVRRNYQSGHVYFIANRSKADYRGWISLRDRAASAAIFDPMTGSRGDARVRRSTDSELDVYLSLGPGETVIIRTGGAGIGEDYVFGEPSGAPIEIPGPWTLRFDTGGPTLPPAREVRRLAPWTTFGGEDVQQFSGTAVYSATFPRPSGDASTWRLDLGRVHDSARLRLNGRDLGTLIGPSFTVTLESSQLLPQNELNVYVTNLMANRIAALDRSGVRWKKFYNVNFPSRLPENRGPDGLFTAAKWPALDSGLIGPVTLTPLAGR